MSNNCVFHKIYNYYVGDVIAVGSFGSIRRAYKQDNLEQFAIKLISKRKIYRNTNYMKMIFAERKLAPILSHPHLMPIYESFESEGQIFQIMKFAHSNLIGFIKNYRISIKDKIQIIDDILSAIEYLHNNWICHRDIKLDNILVDENGDVILSDFGFASFALEKLHEREGSVGYAAPEILSGESYDGLKSDMWSLGVLIFTFFAGYTPFKGNNYDTNVNYKDIPSHFVPIISSLLQINPNARPNIKQIRENPVFSCLEERTINNEIDFNQFIIDPSKSICKRISELFRISLDEVQLNVCSKSISEEKIFYYLIYNKLMENGETFYNNHNEISSCPSTNLPQILPMQQMCESYSNRKSFSLPKNQKSKKVADELKKILMKKKFCVSESLTGINKAVLNTSNDDIRLNYEVEDSSNECLIRLSMDDPTGQNLDMICSTIKENLSVD